MNETRKRELEELVEKNASGRPARWVRDMERAEKCRETAKKVARLLAESRAEYDDIDTIFRMSKGYLTVTLVEDDA